MAGIGSMNYGRFIVYNVVGGIAWVAICLFGGYFFGNLPFVKENFSVVILAIIFISILPGVYEFVRHKVDKRRRAAELARPTPASRLAGALCPRRLCGLI